MKIRAYSCGQFLRSASAYQDGRLAPEDRFSFESHRRVCSSCRVKAEQTREISAQLKALPVRLAPPNLRSELRVIASREALRNRNRATLQSRWAAWRTELQLFTDNLMRPLAIPTAGGFFSALILFAMLAPGLSSRVSLTDDVPTGLHSDVQVMFMVPPGFSNTQDLIVEVTIDEHGRMTDYNIPSGQALSNPEILRTIENNLLFTRFQPARTFGQPMPAKVLVNFRTNSIDVKG
jgi:hypothetical protein